MKCVWTTLLSAGAAWVIRGITREGALPACSVSTAHAGEQTGVFGEQQSRRVGSRLASAGGDRVTPGNLFSMILLSMHPAKRRITSESMYPVKTVSLPKEIAGTKTVF